MCVCAYLCVCVCACACIASCSSICAGPSHRHDSAHRRRRLRQPRAPPLRALGVRTAPHCTSDGRRRHVARPLTRLPWRHHASRPRRVHARAGAVRCVAAGGRAGEGSESAFRCGRPARLFLDPPPPSLPPGPRAGAGALCGRPDRPRGAGRDAFAPRGDGGFAALAVVAVVTLRCAGTTRRTVPRGRACSSTSGRRAPRASCCRTSRACCSAGNRWLGSFGVARFSAAGFGRCICQCPR
jgi:hypothetical protein